MKASRGLSCIFRKKSLKKSEKVKKIEKSLYFAYFISLQLIL